MRRAVRRSRIPKARHARGRSPPDRHRRNASAQPMRRADLRHHPPVGPRLARRRTECALARNAAFRIGDGAVLLAPAGRRQHDIGKARGVGRPAVGDDDERTSAQRRAHPPGARHAGGRIGVDDPQRLDRAVAARRRTVRRPSVPAALRCAAPSRTGARDRTSRVVKAHMRGELIGEAADLAPAHRVRLTGQRERPHAGPADAPGRKMAVDDRVDLVGAGRRID